VSRLIARLSLHTRLQLALAAVLIAALVVGGTLSLDAGRRIGQQALQQMAAREAQILALTLTEPLILADLNSAEQLLRQSSRHGDFRHAWLDTDSHTLHVTGLAPAAARPAWFARLLGMAPVRAEREIRAGGRTYGRLRLEQTAEIVEDRLWRLLGRVALTALIASALLAGLMTWITRANLRGLRQILAASHGPVEAHLDERIRLNPSAPPELVVAAEALNAARARLREHVEAVLSERERWRVTLEAIGEAVIVTDADGSVRFMNPVAERLTGWPEAEAQGKAIEAVMRLIDEEHRAPLENPARAALRTDTIQNLATQALLVSRYGIEIPVQDSAAPIHNGEGGLCGAVLVLRDDSERRALLTELRRMAFHDPLTGLPNRRALEGRIERAVRQLQETPDRQHVFCYIDLDQFKLVNDTCGHSAGDVLLVQLAEVMRGLLPSVEERRDAPMLARLGGDEFGLLLFDTGLEAAAALAGRMLSAIQENVYQVEQRRFRLGASVGIAAISAGDRASQVLARADSACYLAKRHGRNRVELWRPEDAALRLQSEEMEWVGRLEHYLEHHRLHLWRQRIVPVATPERGGYYEILLRYVDETGAIQPPAALLAAAERYGLAPSLDRWVLRRLLAYLRQHPEDDAVYALNLSGQTLSDPLFAEVVRDALAAAGISPERIQFELTETAVVQDIAAAQRFIRDVRTMGCRFCLDDFGSGLSSFAYLKGLDADTLKIDGAFVRNLDSEPLDFVIVNAIAQVGRDLKLKTVAEFVESAAILARLAEIGVDYAQGYHIHRPEPFIAGSA
jgi:diguanylate cyclase (GGDEF)-like protein/PAS domain S-box-containing protein